MRIEKYTFKSKGSEYLDPQLMLSWLFIKDSAEYSSETRRLTGSGFTGKILSIFNITLVLFGREFGVRIEFNERKVTQEEAKSIYHKRQEFL